MQRIHVFVDESGDEHLHVDRGASPKYVLTAILVQDKDLAEFIETANKVRRFYFQTGEIKSSKVGAQAARRKLILEKLCALKFWSLSFVVAKERISPDSGLRFAQTFLKHVAKRLCSHLPLADEVCVSFDEKGRVKFKREFMAYLERAFQSQDLFRVMKFDHLKSDDHVPVQVADFVAGSIAKWHAHRAESSALGIDQLLRGKTSVMEWPTLRTEGLLPDVESARFDEVVRRESFNRASAYLDAYAQENDADISLRCMFIDWLISNANFSNSEFMHAEEILRKLHNEYEIEMDAQALRNKVVGPLRDYGLLIASSQKGYKIPDKLEDLRRYVDLCSSQIPPAVSRLRRARDVLRFATGGELDILEGEGLGDLRAIAEASWE